MLKPNGLDVVKRLDAIEHRGLYMSLYDMIGKMRSGSMEKREYLKVLDDLQNQIERKASRLYVNPLL